MKRAISVLTLVVAILLAAGCATADRSVSTDPGSTDLEVRIYEVFGMDCPGCHGGLEKLVLRVQGVEAAQANWEQKRLTVTVSSGVELDDEAVFEAVRQANFTPGERLQ
ncbi:MAG: cation transporter [Acidobacteria bacterium]|uniref:Cation transporter n=1 Tax=Candidatus Polarisedimenticola svalbardensis TaxID=2886004 RepID=A0A8J6Y673_9BACT|nr:cation transporter [Candidatus Polarisedimenticola svalbardensis]